MTHAQFVEDWNTTRMMTRPDPTSSGWKHRHYIAWKFTRSGKPTHEAEEALRDMLIALGRYADAYKQEYDSEVGTDGVLGQAWLDMARGFVMLLNGEVGRFDAGTLDGCVRELAKRAGFEEEL
jgi:hypothetical protein